MPVARIHSAALWGIEAQPVIVEVDVSAGMPVLTTVGLPDSAVRESRVRVKSAIQNSGFEFPVRRVAVNLAPADLPKQGTGLDLPIALAILAASGQVAPEALAEAWAFGELSLEGGVRPVPGILPALLAARRHRVRRVLVPAGCACEASLVPGVEIWELPTLASCARALATGSPPQSGPPAPPRGPGGAADSAAAPAVAPGPPPEPGPGAGEEEGLDLADVRGQSQGRRALEIVAAGGHSLLMVGPPGAGKTMLAQRLPALLPDLRGEERLEVSCVYSVAEPERLRRGPLTRPPFRAPHHTLSLSALIGGGNDPRPGEVSLAHHGVLFLDEAGEFRPAVLEALRQPIEEGEVRVARHRRAVRFPARPILVIAMNPCGCGYRGDPARPCVCSPASLRRSLRCLSGPLIDRIDLRVEMPRPDPASWEAPRESTLAVRRRVESARERMRERNPASRHLNAHLRPAELARACELAGGTRALLRDAAEHFALSPRGVHRVLKVARTLADLEGEDRVLERHVAEAIQYRVRQPL